MNDEIYYAPDIVPVFTNVKEKSNGIYPIDRIRPLPNNFEPQHGYSWNLVWPSFNHRPRCAPKFPIASKNNLSITQISELVGF
jgi:hypothetical protein